MLLTKLADFIKEVDMYISQHAVYISKLEKAIREGKSFEHKDCHTCNLGKDWDEKVVPVKDQLPDSIKALVEEIENIHCQFHEVSMRIDPSNPKGTDEENIKAMKGLSANLFRKFLELKKVLKEE